MIEAIRVEVRVAGNDFSDREKEILKVLFLQISMLSNIKAVGANMAINPVSDENPDCVYHMDFCFENGLTQEQSNEFEKQFQGRIIVSLERMLEFTGVEVKTTPR